MPKAGDRFVTTLEGIVQSEGGGSPFCILHPVMPVTVDVLNARGIVDTRALTIDRNFWRRFAVDVDWSRLGCGLGSLRTHIVFDVTAASVAYDCNHVLKPVGTFEPIPVEAGV